MKNNKTVLIIGAAGFVGPYLINNLRKHNYRVIPSKLKSQKTKDKSFIDLDILNKENVFNVLNKYKPRYIVNLAAQASVALSWKNPLLTFNINVIGVLNILETIKQLNLKTRVLLIGTSEEYGNQNKIPIKENAECKPNNFYALSKLAQENIAQIYVKNYGLDIVFTRSFNHIGPHQSLGFVVPDFCYQIVKAEKTNKVATIYVGNLTVKRDFSDVRDVVEAYRLLLEKGKSGEIYNVGSGKATSIKKILNNLLKLSKKKIQIHIDQSKLRPGDTSIVVSDIKKLKKDTNYNPKHNAIETLPKILDYFRKY